MSKQGLIFVAAIALTGVAFGVTSDAVDVRPQSAGRVWQTVIDPVGPLTATSSHKYRVNRSGEANFSPWGTNSIAHAFTAMRRVSQIHNDGNWNGCWRLAIHLKPLVDVE